MVKIRLSMVAAMLIMVLPVLVNILLLWELGVPLVSASALIGAIPAFLVLVYFGDV